MSLSELLAYVPPEHHAQVERDYAAVTAGEAALVDDHIDSFARIIHDRGLLPAAGLHDFLTYRALRVGYDDAAPSPDAAHYQPMTLLGRGGMGEVYLGSEPVLKRTVAIKRLNEGLRGDYGAHLRFVGEAQVTAQLDHPGIVPVYGLERDADGGLTYAMKFVRGVTLTEVIEEAKRQLAEHGKTDDAHSLKARVETLVPVLNALAYAHRRGVIHRDLKPDNIMVGRFGEVLVMDWGLARIVKRDELRTGVAARPGSGGSGSAQAGASSGGADGGSEVRPLAARQTVLDTASGDDALAAGITVEGAIVGTPDFMSPEQARAEVLDAASDQYALGLILQELVTLKPAIPGRTAEGITDNAKLGKRAPVASTKEPIPRELQAIIARACAFAKADRYKSVEAMADDVRRFLRDESVVADPDSGVRRIERWIGRHRGTALALVLGLVLAVFAVAAIVLWRGQVALEEQREEARQRERTVMGLGSIVEARARKMAEDLHHVELLVARIAEAASVYLQEPAPPSDVVVYRYKDGKRDPDAIPAEAVDSAVYGQKTSLRHPDFHAAPDVDRVALRPAIDQMARLEPELRRTLLESAGAPPGMPIARAERLVLQQGVPLVWAYYAGQNGLGIGLPGTWDYEESPGVAGYDHRAEEWYQLALPVRGPRWSSGADENGLGLLFTCTWTVRDAADQPLGVAAVDVSMARMIDEVLDVPELAKAGAEGILLDREGRVMVRSSQKGVARTLRVYEPPTYEVAELVAAVKARASGHEALPDGRLALWASLGEVGLTYLVIGPEAGLLATSAPSAIQ
ncbi:MAG: protein kinase [Myxococcota bacterium]